MQSNTRISQFGKAACIVSFLSYFVAISSIAKDSRSLAQSHAQRAEALILTNPLEACDLYRQACDLTPDKSPDKPKWLAAQADAEQYCDFKSPGRTLWLHGSAIPPRAERPTTVRESTLKLRKQAAEIAEKYKVQNANFYWADLAICEADAGHRQQYIECVHHALNLYSRKNDDGALLTNSGMMSPLLFKNDTDTIENLLLEALAKTERVKGPRSIEMQAQLTDLFDFYVKQKNYDKAGPLLNEILKFDLTTGATQSNENDCVASPYLNPRPFNSVQIIRNLCQTLQPFTTTSTFARTSLQTILKAQEKSLKPNDERLVLTYNMLGECNFALKNYTEADTYYQQAYALTKHYHKGDFAVRQAGEHFIDNLKKVGKIDEADKLANLPWLGTGK